MRNTAARKRKLPSDERARNRDVADIVLSERESAAVLDEYRNLIDLFPQAFFECDAEGRIRAASRNAMKMFGYSEREFTAGLMITDLIAKADVERVRAQFEMISTEGRSSCTGFTARRKDGGVFDIMAAGVPIHSGAENPGVRYLVSSAHISGHMEENFCGCDQVIEQSDELVMVLDRNRCFLLSNGSFRDYYGLTHEDINGWRVDEVMGDAFSRSVLGPAIDNVFSGEHVQFSHSRVFPEKGEREMLITMSPFRCGGEITGAMFLAKDITELKQTERKLLDRFRFLQLLLDTIPNPVVYKNTDGRFEGCNRAFLEFINKSAEMIIGKSIEEFPQGKENDIIRDLDRHIFHENAADVMETVLHAGDGTSRDVLVYKEPYRDTSAGNAGMVAVIVDISERKNSEEALRKTSMLLETIFSTVHFLVAYLDTDFNFIRVNRAYAEVDGHEPSFYVGKNHFDIYPNEENQEIFRRVVETGERYHTYARPFCYPEHPEWGITYWDWLLEPLKDDEGTVTGLLLSLVDRTELEKVQKALRESEEQFRSIFFNIPVPTTMFQAFNGSLEITDYNLAASQYTEGKIFKLKGKRASDIYRDRQDLLSLLNHCLSERTVLSIETPYRFLATGEERYIHFTFAYVAENIVLSHWQDFTERKRTLDKLLLYQSKLRSLSSELSRVEERERRKIAQYLHDRIAHNLSLSQMRLEMVHGQLSDPSELDLTIKLMNDMVDETRSLILELSPPALYELGFVESLEWLADYFQRKYNLLLSLIWEGNPGKIDDDIRVLLFHSVRELCVNVSRHSKASIVKIRVNWGNDMVRITIEDNGVGFDTDILQAPICGSGGFGLFKIGEQMQYIGGALHVYSEPERGTRAVLISPLQHITHQS